MTDTNLIPVIESDREFAVDYAKRRNMPKATIEKYRNGGGDAEPLLQLIARQRVALTDSFQARIDRLSADNDALQDANDKLRTEKTTFTSVNNNLVATNASKSEEISFLKKALNAIKVRAQGSIFGKGKDITKLVDEALYIPGE